MIFESRTFVRAMLRFLRRAPRGLLRLVVSGGLRLFSGIYLVFFGLRLRFEEGFDLVGTPLLAAAAGAGSLVLGAQTVVRSLREIAQGDVFLAGIPDSPEEPD